MNKVIAILAISLITISCSHYKWLDKHKDKICNEYCTTIIHIDSVFVDSILTITKLDTSYLTITIGCDSLKQAYIKALNEKTGQIRYKYVLKDNVLSVKAYTDTIEQLQIKLRNCKNKIVEKKIYVEKQKNNLYLYIIIGGLLAIVLFLLAKR